jgi:hypothetical protein
MQKPIQCGWAFCFLICYIFCLTCKCAMFSRFLGKGSHSADAFKPGASGTRGVEVVQDGAEIAWGLWSSSGKSHQPAPVSVEPARASRMTAQAAPASAAPPAQKLLSAEQLKQMALEVIEQHHQRVANSIRNMWGLAECSPYINRLIMAGGDGLGHNRVGFNQEAVDAMLVLVDLHDAEFGAG